MILLQRLLAASGSILQGDSGHATPDVTKVQVIALGQVVIVVLIVLGFDLDSTTQQLLIGLSAALAAVLPVSDAVIRHGRAANLTEISSAQKAPADGAPKLVGISSAERDLIVADLLALDDVSGPS